MRLLDVILVLGGMETNTNVLDALHSTLNPESTNVTCSSYGYIFSPEISFFTTTMHYIRRSVLCENHVAPHSRREIS